MGRNYDVMRLNGGLISSRRSTYSSCAYLDFDSEYRMDIVAKAARMYPEPVVESSTKAMVMWPFE